MSIPAYIIISWSGEINQIPNGWFLCDGTNGTPDLRNRFVVGAGNTYSLDATGGSVDNIIVEHTHDSSLSSVDSHTHSVRYQKFAEQNTQRIGAFSSSTQSFIINLQNYTHNHSVTIDNAGSSEVNGNLPPYYALAFIMKGGE